eukprot:m.86464 g.86464  ORF g.86464 m.86464 type:complete len:153 (-) comp17964_c0_seq3:242-700(-)
MHELSSCSERAKTFYEKDKVLAKIHTDEDEWASWKKMGDPVLHIELRRWADIMVVAPLDANTLAKFANGFSDNLVTCVARAWDFAKPIVVCPAMNTAMWEHPTTARNLKLLTDMGYHVIDPVSKLLACGDSGLGAMAGIDTICSTTQKLLFH